MMEKSIKVMIGIMALALTAYNGYDFFFDHDIFETVLLPLKHAPEGQFLFIKGLKYSPAIPMFLSFFPFLDPAGFLIILVTTAFIATALNFNKILMLFNVSPIIRNFTLFFWLISWPVFYVFTVLDDNAFQICMLMFSFFLLIKSFTQNKNISQLVSIGLSFGLCLAIHLQTIILLPLFLIGLIDFKNISLTLKSWLIFGASTFMIALPFFLPHIYQAGASDPSGGFLFHKTHSLLGVIKQSQFHLKDWIIEWIKMILQSINIWGKKAQKIPWVCFFYIINTVGIISLYKNKRKDKNNNDNYLKSFFVLCWLGFIAILAYTFLMFKHDPERWIMGTFFIFLTFGISLDRITKQKTKYQRPLFLICFMFMVIPTISGLIHFIKNNPRTNILAYQKIAKFITPKSILIGHRSFNYSTPYFTKEEVILIEQDGYEVYNPNISAKSFSYKKGNPLENNIFEQKNQNILIHRDAISILKEIYPEVRTKVHEKTNDLSYVFL